MIFIIGGLVGAIVLIVVYGVSQMNAAPASNNVVQGAPVTQGSTPQYLGMTGPTYSGPAPGPDTAIVRTVVRPETTAQPTARPTIPPERTTYDGGGGGHSASSSAQDEAAAQAREARRRAAEDAREQLRRRQERVDSAMRSLGGVTIVDQHDSERVVTSTGAQSDAGPGAAVPADAREYPAPSGPVLALDTSIPVELTRSVDSTFGGQFEVRVTDNVRDETQRVILIPRNARCYGTASAGGVDGQARLYGSFDLCKFPDRERLVLDHFPAIDTDGATGIKARVDDHGAGRRGRGSTLLAAPGMLLGTVIPQAGGIAGSASTAVALAQSSRAGQAIPGPTLYLDASEKRPRAFSILVTHDIGLHAYTAAAAKQTSEVTQ